MKLLKNITFLKFNALNLFKETKLIFAQDIPGESQKEQAAIEAEKKELEKLSASKRIKGLKEYKNQLDRSDKVEVKMGKNGQIPDAAREIIKKIKLPKIEKQAFLNDIGVAIQEITYNTKIFDNIIKNLPLSVVFDRRVLRFEKTLPNGQKTIVFAKHLNEVQGTYLESYENFEARRMDLVRRQIEFRRKFQTENVEKGQALDQLIDKDGEKYVKKGNLDNKTHQYPYTFNFRNDKGKVDRKLEKETRIENVIDVAALTGGTMNLRIHLIGKTPGGKSVEGWAYYHKQLKTFVYEKTGERVKIFDGNVIDQFNYVKAPVVKKAGVEAQKQAPAVAQRQEVKTEGTQAAPKMTREQQIQSRTWELTGRYESSIMNNDKFSVPSFLQEDTHFEKNWGRISHWFENILTRAPFGITSVDGRRKYSQNVIQDYMNSRLYPADFFKYPVNGKALYEGGYKKFQKDYKDFSKKLFNKEMNANDPKWLKVQEIMLGIGSVIEALQRVRLYDVKKESKEDAIKPKLAGIGELSDKEKTELAGVQYHNLESLLHKKENGPKGVDIGVTPKVLAEITKKAKEKEIPDLDVNKLLADKGGLKLVFMLFGFDTLVKMNCLKKLDDKHYILVKVPNVDWSKALLALRENGLNGKEKMWDTSKDSMAKWEKVRASLDSGEKSRLFIEKLFKADRKTVRQDLNWWQRMWHLTDWKGTKERKVSMEYLSKVTFNPRDFEKYMCEGRGYLDLMEKTSERVPGTSIYAPNEQKVLSEVNKNLEYGVLYTLMQSTNKDLSKVMDSIVKEFKLEGKVQLKQPYEANKVVNLQTIVNAISLKNVDVNALSETHIKFIRLGHVLGREIETSKNWSESMQENLSGNPFIRDIQMKALESGCSIGQLKEIEQRVHFGIFGLSKGMTPDHVKVGGGAAAVIELGKWGGQTWNFTVAAAGMDGKFLPFAAIGAKAKLGEKVTLRWNIGTTVGFSGASLAFERKVTKEWDMYGGASVGADWKGLSVGAGVALGAMWNKERAEQLKVNSAINERGIKNIDDLLKQGKRDEAAKEILANSTFGEYLKALKTKLDLNTDVVIDIYEKARVDWINAARTGVKVPPITGFGAGVFAGFNPKAPSFKGLAVGAYITFQIPGTKVNYVIRHEHPKFSEYVQSQAAEKDLEKALKKQGLSNYVIAKQTLTASTGTLYFDPKAGRANAALPEGPEEGQKSMAIKQGEENMDLSSMGTFEAIKSRLAEVDIHAELVGNLIALTPLNTQGSNLEMLIDPALKQKGLILDAQNNRILLAASEAEKLLITKTTYRYPFERKGALNLQVISFKSDPSKSNIEIREDSPVYIYKYNGEKFRLVEGEERRRLYDKANVMTLEEYQRRLNAGEKFESYNDHKFEYSTGEGRALTNEMYSALGMREAEKIRDGFELRNICEKWYGKNGETFDRELAKVSSLGQEEAYKVQLFNRLNKQIKPAADLNNQEFNLFYSYLLDKSFTKLRESGNKTVIQARIEKRNRLFKEYINKEIKNFIKNNPKKWESITAGMDPKPTTESVANYLFLCMPQNVKALDEFSKEQVEITKGMKYASYTRKFGKLESMPSSYGTDNPPEFRKIMTLLKPTTLDINSVNPHEKAAARLTLSLLSPLDADNLDNNIGVSKFLHSELALLLLSARVPGKNVSPLIEVLGKDSYKGLTEIYKALKNGASTNEFIQAVNDNKPAFDRFVTLVNGIRNAQLNGEKTYTFENKYVFHVEKTDIYAGAYLKCGNGTLVLDQKFGVTTTETKTANWYSAKVGKNISVVPHEGVAYKDLTLGWVHGMKFARHKGPPPERPPETPGKGSVPER